MKKPMNIAPTFVISLDCIVKKIVEMLDVVARDDGGFLL